MRGKLISIIILLFLETEAKMSHARDARALQEPCRYYAISESTMVYGHQVKQISTCCFQITVILLLSLAAILWTTAHVTSRLWHNERKRRQHALDARERHTLHALTVELLAHRKLLTTARSRDSMREQTLHKLRAQPALEQRSLW